MKGLASVLQALHAATDLRSWDGRGRPGPGTRDVSDLRQVWSPKRLRDQGGRGKTTVCGTNLPA